MLVHLIKRSFANQKKAMMLMISSVAVGTAMAASLITISLEISGKVSRELRSFGANILIEPRIEGLADISEQTRYLREEDIIKVKTIFWRHNILGVMPFLKSPVDVRTHDETERIDVIGTWYDKELQLPGSTDYFSFGVKTVSPWWHIEGEWPDSSEKIIIGASLAERLGMQRGERISLDNRYFLISGVLETGGNEDDLIFMDIDALQDLKQLQDKVSKVYVSALTKPMDEFAYKDPETMGQLEYEKWYCTGYVTSIARQLEEVFQGSMAKPIWQIAETEGKILERLRLLIYFLCATALIASALGVSTTMIASVLRRVDEIGLMKSIGADSGKIISVFFTEGIIIGFIGGILGYVLAILASKYIGLRVFNTAFGQGLTLLPIAMVSAVFISAAGTVIPIKKALSIKPAIVLKGAE